MLRMLTSLLVLFYCLPVSAANPVFDYNDNCGKAYRAFMALRMEEGAASIASELKANPNNLMAVYVADYEDCLLLLMNADKQVYDQRASHFEERLNQLEKGDKSSPWYLFCKAGLYMHWAIVGVRFGEQYSAGLKFRKSFSLLKENQRLFPSFEHNNIFLGLEESVVGSLPGNYKWLASIFGMQGSVKGGIAKLSSFVNAHDIKYPFFAETELYYLYVRFYLAAEQKETWAYLSAPQYVTAKNLLNTYVKTSIALDYRKADVAFETLQSNVSPADYARYPILYYQAGTALLNRLDTAGVSYFQQFLSAHKSDSYIKDTWQKMGFAWYVNNNLPKAAICMQQISLQGTDRLDADKQAQRFADHKTWPNMKLLEARLLIEGGYYNRALGILTEMNPLQLANMADKAEYYFRLGRIYEELALAGIGKGNFQNALANYALAITHGKGRREQFAARAALQTGRVYEALGLYTEAIARYQESLDMPAHDFQNSIDQQAKAGKLRVQEKLQH
jgi:hypothetical protein